MDPDETETETENDGVVVTWHRIAEPGELEDGRVRTVTVDRRSLAVSCFQGRVGALDNHCPHQGGPLGEGSIEKGWLRCPWHGYDYDPVTGEPPGGFSDAPTAFPVETRDDGVYVGLPAHPAHRRTVADAVVETLVAWGVTHVFGMVGHSNLGLAEALRGAEGRGEITYVGIRHEGAAAFAASAYGKLTGRPAACLAIAGPGSTNLLTGLYDAKVDRSPVIALSGQVPSKVLGRGAFQDVDLTAAFADVAYWSKTVLNGSDPAELAALACKHTLGERGPTHLVFPDEVQVLPCDVPASPPTGRRPQWPVDPPPDRMAAAVAAVSAAKRPAIVVGHGARAGLADVLALAERLHAPVLTTFKAKGLVPDDHPLAAGVLGRSGTPVASWLMNEADQLIVFGASFSNHTGIAAYKPIVQVDDDPEGLARFHPVAVGVPGDVATVARAVLAELGPEVQPVDQRADVAERWALWRAEKQRRLADDNGRGVNSAAVFEALGRHTPADAVISVDVGNNTYSFGRYFESKGQPVLMSGYLGSIGFGVPAALGAWAGAPGRPLLAVCGDGGLGQYLAELTTVAAHRLPLVIVLVDNGQLGKISKEQRAAEYDVWQTTLHNPDFAAFAELCGLRAYPVRQASELDAALSAAFAGVAAGAGPALVHVHADPDLT